jgi:bifunctional UDP-N-acetylglucosamine pyrophosphorylase / glucosamine-1-phosphate N-acetyltransferase
MSPCTLSNSDCASPSSPRALIAIILAAGKGTRMQSDLPKVMHPVAGRPMVRWVVDAAREIGCTRIVLVVGYGAELIEAEFAGDRDVEFALQAEQLGTGHAVSMSKALLESVAMGTDFFVLCGDGPLIRSATLGALLTAHRSATASATLATSVIDEPTGYGRIVRNSTGAFERIVEHKDASEIERAIGEINPSYYCVRGEELFTTLAQIGNSNRSGEYYFTDLFGILASAGHTVYAVDAVPAEDVLSINDPTQLATVDAILRARPVSRTANTSQRPHPTMGVSQ